MQGDESHHKGDPESSILVETKHFIGRWAARLGYFLGVAYGEVARPKDKHPMPSGFLALKTVFPCCSASYIIEDIAHRLVNPPRYVFDEDSGKPLMFEKYAIDNAGFSQSKLSRSTRVSSPNLKYRSITGAYNNVSVPWLGEGGRGYGINDVRSQKASLRTLPQAEELVDKFLMRKDPNFSMEKGHVLPTVNAPNCTNDLIASLALCAIHDFFRSDTGRSASSPGVDRPWINNHSSYLDCQILYGWTEESSKRIRTMKDGLLYDGAIADSRMERLPVCHAIIMLLGKEHNYIARKLKELYPDRFTMDEDLYQHARLITCATYVNVVVDLYLQGLFSETGRSNAPLVDPRVRTSTPPVGYHSNYEFNLMYRWHTMVPSFWTPMSNMEHQPPQIAEAIKKGDFLSDLPAMSDDAMRAVFVNAMRTPAGAFVPHGTPLFLREAEIKMVKDARRMNVCCFNRFRERLGLDPYPTFEALCGDEALAAELAAVYPSVDDVELVIGMRVERVEMVVGAGLPPTMGHAVLGDAFTAVSQDRFYSTDFNEDVYTEFGLHHAKTVTMVDLLNRHLGMELPPETLLCKLDSWNK